MYSRDQLHDSWLQDHEREQRIADHTRLIDEDYEYECTRDRQEEEAARTAIPTASLTSNQTLSEVTDASRN